MTAEVYIPKMSDHMETGRIVRWLVNEGETVTRGQVLFEIETDKAVGEVESPADGVLQGVRVLEGGEALVGEPVAFIAQTDATLHPTSSLNQHSQISSQQSNIIPATPVARRMAKDLGIDLRLVHGSGPHGRVREGDVRAFHAEKETGVESADQVKSAGPLEQLTYRTPENLELSAIQKITGERMVASIRNIPHFFLQVDVDMTHALDLIEQVRERIKNETGERVSLTALLVRVAAQALKAHPRVNASFEDGTLKIHSQIHIGVAVGTGGGLVVPVIHQADQKDLAQIAAMVKRYQRQLDGLRFAPHELDGATFSLSNLGMYGVDRFSAIINPPQSAILAAGRIVRTPVAREDDSVAVRPMMSLTLSVDHRSLDGVQGALFLAEVKALLEQPYFLI